MKKLHRPGHDTSIPDAAVVAAIVIAGLTVFLLVLLAMVVPAQAADDVDVHVTITETSSCHHAPWLPQYPSENVCAFSSN